MILYRFDCPNSPKLQIHFMIFALHINMYLSLYYLSWVSSREDIPASSNSRTFILKANFEFEFYHADKASTLMYMRTYVQGNNKKI